MMKLALAVILFILPHASQPLTAVGFMEAGTPSYAEWSRLAIQRAQAHYPDAQIIDYLYMGSHQKDDVTEESFRLWLRERDREYAVVVRVTYLTETGKLKDVRFQEIQPPQ
ncbi:DUF3889 domain-containing protein [Sporosarcina trichiuri]|uniref:DUF3889 domain-containing protein n=1 Tax=Sporosarcina trichiuri TaxID=3056445 RepID=UPI0025B39B88|nr:DUF3889 domain-containing protein [Sporosarcina sp. 0.2-SM1T-5]WJY26837.1 DUF3889 domain-containing protein [Sporosarcina sp. 0.2-SM1T-5]